MNKLLSILLACIFFYGHALAGPTHEYQLDNGLKLVVREDHRTPVAIFQIWYKVGSSYETLGITGISHALEHMMFKGTPTYPAGKLAKLITNNGGKFNAFTSRDFTGYYEFMTVDQLPLSFKLESDRMTNLILPEKEFKKEIQVVMEERRMRTDDIPSGTLEERFDAASFVSTPYHHPIVGWMNDLQHMTVQDLLDWYNKWYGPNNAIVIVVGDVQPEHVLALTKKYFGPIKPITLPAIKPSKEIADFGQRKITVNFPAKVPSVIMGFNTPTLVTSNVDWHPYALDVVAEILAGGESARFEKSLVLDKKLADNVGARYDSSSRLPSNFKIYATPKHNVKSKKLVKAIMREVQQLQEHLVTPEELQRVKTQVIASNVYLRDSIVHQANIMGALESVGLSWKLIDDYASHIQAITAEQVQAVAKQYFTPPRLTVAYLKPKAIHTHKVEGK